MNTQKYDFIKKKNVFVLIIKARLITNVFCYELQFTLQVNSLNITYLLPILTLSIIFKFASPLL